MEKVKQYVGGCEELLLEEKVDRRRYKGDREARCSNQHFFKKKSGIFFFDTRIAPISIPTKRKYQSNIQENRGEGEGDREERERGEKQELRLA